MLSPWVPKISYGELVFGQPLPSQYEYLKLEPSYEDADWDVYQLVGESIRVSVTDNQITSIECWDEFYIDLKNIVGLEFNECVDLLGGGFELQATGFCSGEEEYTKEELGITLWVVRSVISGVTIQGD